MRLAVVRSCADIRQHRLIHVDDDLIAIARRVNRLGSAAQKALREVPQGIGSTRAVRVFIVAPPRPSPPPMFPRKHFRIPIPVPCGPIASAAASQRLLENRADFGWQAPLNHERPAVLLVEEAMQIAPRMLFVRGLRRVAPLAPTVLTNEPLDV